MFRFQAGQHQTCRHSLQVPFPGARNRLVKVVNVENQMAIGRCETAHVLHMRIAAELHRSNPVDAWLPKIRRHDRDTPPRKKANGESDMRRYFSGNRLTTLPSVALSSVSSAEILRLLGSKFTQLIAAQFLALLLSLFQSSVPVPPLGSRCVPPKADRESTRPSMLRMIARGFALCSSAGSRIFGKVLIAHRPCKTQNRGRSDRCELFVRRRRVRSAVMHRIAHLNARWESR